MPFVELETKKIEYIIRNLERLRIDRQLMFEQQEEFEKRISKLEKKRKSWFRRMFHN